MRFFNTEGPVVPEDHYSIPPLQRWDLEEVLTLIARRNIFCCTRPARPARPPACWRWRLI